MMALWLVAASSTLLDRLQDGFGNELSLDRVTWSECDATSHFASSRPALIGGPFVDAIGARKWSDEDLLTAHLGGPLVRARVLQGQLGVPYFTTEGKIPVSAAATARQRQMSLAAIPLSSLLRDDNTRGQTVTATALDASVNYITAQRSTGSVAKYYSTDLAAHFSPSLAMGFPSQCFWNRAGAVDPNGTSTHIWLSSGMPTTRMHYDGQYNFFYQARGRKHFLLLPPCELRKVALFPYVSQLSRQAAVDNDELASSEVDVSLLSNVSYISVVLEAGQLLFLPPFWLHRVTSLSQVSVSVNTWSDVEEMFTFDEIMPKIVLPFDLSWPLDKRIASLKEWFSILKNAVLPNVADFFAVMLQKRFALLEMSPMCSVECGANNLISEEERRKILRYAVPVIERLMAMLDEHVRELMLASYLEKCADSVLLGSDCNLIRFMMTCLV